MKKFMQDHPITTFLIFDTLISGIVSIVKILKGPSDKNDDDTLIETTFVED